MFARPAIIIHNSKPNPQYRRVRALRRTIVVDGKPHSVTSGVAKALHKNIVRAARRIVQLDDVDQYARLGKRVSTYNIVWTRADDADFTIDE